MQSGIYWGYVGLVEGLVGRIKTEFGAAIAGPLTTTRTISRAPDTQLNPYPAAVK